MKEVRLKMPRRNQTLVPQAAAALERLKQETAAELGIPNYQGYLGDVPSKQNGAVGGNMVRKMIRLAESQIAGAASPTAVTGPLIQAQAQPPSPGAAPGMAGGAPAGFAGPGAAR